MPKKFELEGGDKSLERLRKLMRSERKRKGCSQEKVAKIMGISPAYLSQLENSKRHIYWELWIAWCSALSTSPSYFVDKWMRVGAFDRYDKKRKLEYHKIIDQMLELSLSTELDNLMLYFKGLMAQELEARRKEDKKERFADKFRKEEGKGSSADLEKSITTAKSTEEKLSEKEFTYRAIERLREPRMKEHPGIHSVSSGFHEAWKKYYGTDPMDGIQRLIFQGEVDIRHVKGGVVIYLPGEAPGKKALDIILE